MCACQYWVIFVWVFVKRTSVWFFVRVPVIGRKASTQISFKTKILTFRIVVWFSIAIFTVSCKVWHISWEDCSEDSSMDDSCDCPDFIFRIASRRKGFGNRAHVFDRRIAIFCRKDKSQNRFIFFNHIRTLSTVYKFILNDKRFGRIRSFSDLISQLEAG